MQPCWRYTATYALSGQDFRGGGWSGNVGSVHKYHQTWDMLPQENSEIYNLWNGFCWFLRLLLNTCIIVISQWPLLAHVCYNVDHTHSYWWWTWSKQCKVKATCKVAGELRWWRLQSKASLYVQSSWGEGGGSSPPPLPSDYGKKKSLLPCSAVQESVAVAVQYWLQYGAPSHLAVATSATSHLAMTTGAPLLDWWLLLTWLVCLRVQLVFYCNLPMSLVAVTRVYPLAFISLPVSNSDHSSTGQLVVNFNVATFNLQALIK